jgi:hypothetical protein
LSESSYSQIPLNDLSENSLKWSEDQIYFIFGSGPLILSALGFFLLFVMKKFLNVRWKTKLTLTWMAFLMVNALPCSILAGVFFYDGFGVAFQWMFGSYIGRGLVALMVLALLIVFSRFWQRMFLKASYTSAFLGTGRHQKIFIKNVFLKPWIYGFFILLIFNWPFSNFFWRAFLLSLGYMAIALIDPDSRMLHQPHIRKSDKKIFTTRYQPVFFAAGLALIWIADNFIINF